MNGKTYRDTQLGEIAHSVAVERTLEHVVTYRGEPVGEKHEEDKTSAERQPP
jgi:hypothetical protein